MCIVVLEGIFFIGPLVPCFFVASIACACYRAFVQSGVAVKMLYPRSLDCLRAMPQSPPVFKLLLGLMLASASIITEGRPMRAPEYRPNADGTPFAPRTRNAHDTPAHIAAETPVGMSPKTASANLKSADKGGTEMMVVDSTYMASTCQNEATVILTGTCMSSL